MTSASSKEEILNFLGPTSSYERRKRGRRHDFMKDRKVVPGIPPELEKRPEYKIRLPRFKIPTELRKIIGMPLEDALASKEFSIQMDSGSGYKKFFSALLFAEECQIMEDIKLYDKEGVKMERNGSYFILDVPGLAEKRPSVIIGDHVLVMKHEEAEKKAYQGFVHHVEESSVTLKFAKSFNKVHSKNAKFNVRFTFNRISVRRMHHALESSKTIRRLFPSNQASHNCQPEIRRTMNNLVFIDQSIAQNHHQKRAVAAIKLGFYHPAPFIVFGPPGTGKSVTIVEAIKQLLDDKKEARILVCAPSNSAADGLLLKLRTTMSPDKLARINSISRDLRNFDKEFLEYCKPLAVMDHQVTVSTCITAGAIYALKGEKKYSHIFVDEAGQALEPEVVTALQNASEETRIILAGDPKQLGPIIHSSIARNRSLGTSLIERLVNMDNSPYSFDENFIHGVKLLKNYRSHPAILDFPNREFYEADLEACGDNKVTYSLIKSNILPMKGYPVTFVGVNGKDRREGRSPSWFNAHEAATVLEIVQDLVEKDNVEVNEIGIVTPYCKQVEKIRRLMEKENYEGIDVGTVENFQGRERRVIIISTVRSSTTNIGHDKKFHLGFLNEQKRFCVAVTRARALLAVVGNPNLLFQDECWKKWLQEVRNNGGCKGIPLPEVIEENTE
ncbi:12594_t:CDS:2 [Acaulospora colombiana]|uniref:12594_t:CDS:1 n=1 Tax=Acaulospora colombiana TaxID=27376 RepID=A0ACA9MMC1_9GLOM|nr:12594_t:CDS:2 [Acaulospora colombiana]